MIDGILSKDLSVRATDLLAHEDLTFGSLVDQQTGAILSPIQRATDKGLKFSLIPKGNIGPYRVELAGSLHRYSKKGLHNADDFTATDLRATIMYLENVYRINTKRSVINNLEFGVNISLPFPVSMLLKALLCYKSNAFASHSDSGFAYYQVKLQQYVLKLYDKGTQYGLPGHVLRFEIKVLRMEYLHRQKIFIRTIADLLNDSFYPALGELLNKAFHEILFDEPDVKAYDVPAEKRELLANGRNPRYWQQLDSTSADYARHRQRLHREKIQFCKLLADHRPNYDWQAQTANLLRDKWEALASVTDVALLTGPFERCNGLTNDADHGTFESGIQACHKLTEPTEVNETEQLSQINNSNVAVICDVVDSSTKQQKRRLTASQLRVDPGLLANIEGQYRQYRKGSKESREERAAHNLRNDESNPRNNLKRSINKIHRQPVLFDVSSTLRLTPEQQMLLSMKRMLQR